MSEIELCHLLFGLDIVRLILGDSFQQRQSLVAITSTERQISISDAYLCLLRRTSELIDGILHYLGCFVDVA